MKQAVVTHAGARDHYELAVALYQANYLERLVTDFYSPDLLLPLHKNFTKRASPELPARKVKNLWRANYIRDLAEKDASLSKAAYQLAKKTESDLFFYSYYGYHAFSSAIQENYPGKRILFQLHPHPIAIKHIFTDELALTPSAVNSLMAEHEMKYDEEVIFKLSQESKLAELVVVASSFTKRTLLENGVPENKVIVCPYGIDTTTFQFQPKEVDKRVLNVIFVGQMSQRKGISYLLEAFKKLNHTHIHLVLCGRGILDQAFIESFDLKNLEIKINLPKTELINAIQRADVFVLPSLVEGFGHVILESMACGTPVITTPNTCGADVITEGVDGFIVPIRNASKIAEKLEWCFHNRLVLSEMGRMASEKASLYTWNRFRSKIADIYSLA